jgi:hypothetical protein
VVNIAREIQMIQRMWPRLSDDIRRMYEQRRLSVEASYLGASKRRKYVPVKPPLGMEEAAWYCFAQVIRAKVRRDAGLKDANGEGTESEEDGEERAWAQCEKCAKWRQLALGQAAWAGHFHCEMNTWHAQYDSCVKREDPTAYEDDVLVPPPALSPVQAQPQLQQQEQPQLIAQAFVPPPASAPIVGGGPTDTRHELLAAAAAAGLVPAALATATAAAPAEDMKIPDGAAAPAEDMKILDGAAAPADDATLGVGVGTISDAMLRCLWADMSDGSRRVYLEEGKKAAALAMKLTVALMSATTLPPPACAPGMPCTCTAGACACCRASGLSTTAKARKLSAGTTAASSLPRSRPRRVPADMGFFPDLVLHATSKVSKKAYINRRVDGLNGKTVHFALGTGYTYTEDKLSKDKRAKDPSALLVRKSKKYGLADLAYDINSKYLHDPRSTVFQQSYELNRKATTTQQRVMQPPDSALAKLCKVQPPPQEALAFQSEVPHLYQQQQYGAGIAARSTTDDTQLQRSVQQHEQNGGSGETAMGEAENRPALPTARSAMREEVGFSPVSSDDGTESDDENVSRPSAQVVGGVHGGSGGFSGQWGKEGAAIDLTTGSSGTTEPPICFDPVSDEDEDEE